MAESWIGFVACGIAAVFFGTAAVPIKRFETGDGLFYQWVFCGSIWINGLIVNIIRGFPPFCPLGILGGAIWTIGNLLCVPTIHCIGLATGLLLWASVNMLVGWATGRFGLLGIPAEVPSNPTLNYVGVGICLIATIGYTFIKPNTTNNVKDDTETPLNSTSPDQLMEMNSGDKENKQCDQDSALQMTVNNYSLSETKKRIMGVIFAIVSGVMYGITFLPIMYHQANAPNASQNGLDYIFSYFCGIYLTSTIFFVIYCAIKKNNPKIYPKLILPAIVSGILWSIADSSWFVANATLSEAISFPIILVGPGIVATFWGIFLFKEISGYKNYLILIFCIIIGCIGAILTGMSK